MALKVGDKVRFLNEVGGGTVTGFRGKDMVLVSDADGFEVPTLISDVIVVETNDYNIEVKPKGKKHAPQADKGAAPAAEAAPAAPTSIKQALKVSDDEETEEEADDDLADRAITYKPAVRERRGGDKLTVCLAFVSVNPADFDHTAFEAYLINDCNYHVRYTLLTQGDEGYVRLRCEGEAEPNTRVFLDEVGRDELPAWQRLTLQTLAYKRDKAFRPQPALSVEVKVDVKKFYKPTAFRPGTFFTEPALVFEAVTEGRPVRSTLEVDAEAIKDAMLAPAALAELRRAATAARPAAAEARPQGNAPLVVDLHADQLLDTMVGLSSADILDYQLKVFRDTLDAHLKDRGLGIVFIHGKGEGVLRHAILSELAAHYPSLRHQDASFREYGYGATLVRIG